MGVEHPIILFDGVCNLCNWTVQFVLRRDPRGYFHFAPIQSSAGERLMGDARSQVPARDTIILIDHGRRYFESDAALRIARSLSGLWPLLYAGIWFPRPIRDGVYAFIARNRYRWFGQSAACMVPTPEYMQRFVED
jgi:predicted DCC family thiol-disulfide oxidoreductase YuxK